MSISTSSVFITGFASGLALILPIGAQNTFVLRQGLKRQHVGLIVLICIVCDTLLVAAGVAGLGAVMGSTPWLLNLLRYGGAAFLLFYAFLAARRALRPSATTDTQTNSSLTATAAAVTTLGFTLLNPHVYLDTVLLLGALGGREPEGLRPAFVAGSASAAAVWFTGLGYGARLLTPLFAKPLTWRLLDGVVAVVMFTLALTLL
jgi:L-lysine exporter family protein LysE/ArgO